MRISTALSDEAILVELGRRIARLRIRRGLTQAQFAKQAGIGKRTLERIESGASSQVISVIRVLRGLARIEGLELLLEDATTSPMEILKARRHSERKRARPSRHDAAALPEPEWKWGDET